MSCNKLASKFILKINRLKFLDYTKDLKEKNLCLPFTPGDNITDHKDTVVCEEHWPADYPKLIDYGKERLG